ncbi:hypothetical protein DD238_002603 [Peronospora effusa]|uniref:Uncharacterized protein n=1 Tax=Peronospora effusa TaxID=542832 RepID=A0A3M6VDR6_9STRA|nr:hypothetical protein DD238_002603 [Peronospora effusa]
MMREKQQVKIQAVNNHSNADVVSDKCVIVARVNVELQAMVGKSSHGETQLVVAVDMIILKKV